MRRYVPDTGEVCEFLDCGGGRAPPKTDVPGCEQYSGTATYSPSYLPGFGATAIATSIAASAASAAAGVTSSSSFDWDAAETDTALTSFDLFTTLGSLGPGVYDTVSRYNVSGSDTATSNGTIATGGAVGNANGTSGSTGSAGSASASAPSAPAATGGAARACIGGAGAVYGLMAVVFAL